MTIATRITQKGQVTIPVAVRRTLGLKPRDRVVFTVEGDRAVLRRSESAVLASFGAVEPLNRPEDFRALREAFERGVAEEVMSETP